MPPFGAEPGGKAQDLTCQPFAVGCIGHDSISDKHLQRKRPNTLRCRAILTVNDQTIDKISIDLGNSYRGRLVAKPQEHPVGWSSQRLTSHDRAHRDDWR